MLVYSNPNLRKGLVGHWCPSLGQSGLVLRDRSGYGNHGTLTNMDPPNDWVASGGKIALDFDGSNDYVEFPANSRYWTANSNDSISISLWLKTTQSAVAIPFGFGSGAPGWALGINISAGAFSFYDSAAGAWKTTTGTGYNSGNWTHVAVRVIGTTLKIYKNGIEDSASLTLGSTRYVYTGLNRIGCTLGGTYFYTGQFDDIAIYNRAISVSEVVALYNGGRGYIAKQTLLPTYNPHTAGTGNRRRRLLLGVNG